MYFDITYHTDFHKTTIKKKKHFSLKIKKKHIDKKLRKCHFLR